MSEFLPDAVRRGIDSARIAMLRASHRLCVHDDDRVHRIARLWDGGFALAADAAPPLRGLVDIYDGPRHVAQCLVFAAQDDRGRPIYEFKRMTQVADAPAADFERATALPAGLIGRRV